MTERKPNRVAKVAANQQHSDHRAAVLDWQPTSCNKSPIRTFLPYELCLPSNQQKKSILSVQFGWLAERET